MEPLAERKVLPRLEDGMVHVCAWCHPGRSILLTRPLWTGIQISHDICARHQDEVLAHCFAAIGNAAIVQRALDAADIETTLIFSRKPTS